MKKAELSVTSPNVLRWLEYLPDASKPEDEGKEEGNKIEEEVKEGIYTLLPLWFMMSNILFVSEKEKPKNKSKGKEVAPRTKKQASSKGKEASNVPANKRKTDKTDDISGGSFILTTFINTDKP
jgi:hypothetical protein